MLPSIAGKRCVQSGSGSVSRFTPLEGTLVESRRVVVGPLALLLLVGGVSVVFSEFAVVDMRLSGVLADRCRVLRRVGAALLCCLRCGLALVGPGPRLLLLCPARRALPFGCQARCPWPDPGVNFQHFLDGIFSWADREFVTAPGYVTGKVCSEIEREFAKIQSQTVAKVCSEIEREFASVSGWETDREVTGEVGQGKGVAVCLPKANATALVDVPAAPGLCSDAVSLRDADLHIGKHSKLL